MWWIFKNRGLLLKVIIGVCLFMFLFISSIILFTFYRSSIIGAFIVKQQANKIIQNVENKSNDIAQSLEDLSNKYPELNNIEENTDGMRGSGLNLLLINKISAEGYIKELLTLYRDSAEGKVSDSSIHIGFESLLSMHYNEVKTYDSTGIILNSYLPYRNGKVAWKQQEGKAPAEQMTLRNFNSKTAALAGIRYTDNRMSKSGKYVNAFQVNSAYFSSSPPAIIHPDGVGSGRKADGFYLPDSLSYIDRQFSTMIKRFNIEGENDKIKSAIYGIWHNGGEGHAEYFNGMGAANTKNYFVYAPSHSKKFKNAANEELAKAEWADAVTYTPKAIERQIAKFPDTHFDSIGAGYAMGVWMLINEGYYVTPELYTIIDKSDGVKSALVQGYQKIYNVKLTQNAMMSEIKAKTKDVWEVYPDYITRSQFDKVYGLYSGDATKKGVMWKLEDKTSEAYSNKLNGKSPRILHRTNIEVAGYIFDAEYRGMSVYSKMLKYMGINDDVTNPGNYYDGLQNEFVPPAGNLASALKKIGVTITDPKAYSIIEEGYKVSGFHYVWGGDGESVSQASWSDIIRIQGKGINSNIIDKVFKTKDGTNPAMSKYNRRDENLVGFKKVIFDCSGFVRWAYNHAIGTKAGKELERNTNGQAYSKLLTTLNRKVDTPQVADIYVDAGNHVFLYLGPGNGATLSQEDNLTEKPQRATSRYIWSLEAAETGTQVGIRARPVGPDYMLRRFNALK